MSTPIYSSGTAAPRLTAQRTGISADDFMAILRHLSEAAREVPMNRRLAQVKNSIQSDSSMASSRFHVLLARLESTLRSTQGWIGAASVLVCLGTLRLARALLLTHLVACFWCGCRAKTGAEAGKVDKCTLVHWALTNMIIQLRGIRQEQTCRQRVLGDFLNRNRISTVLSTRLKRYLARSHPQEIRESNIELLRRDSTEILVDLHEEMRLPVLSAHPFFDSLRTNHPHLVRELCHEALQPMLKSPEDIVFCAGEASSRMFFVVSGHVQYMARIPSRDVDPRRPESITTLVRRTLQGGQWLSEAALWTAWIHRGELRPITDCLFFALEASGFARVISSHQSAHIFAAAYARKFVDGLNRSPQSDLAEAAPVDQ